MPAGYTPSCLVSCNGIDVTAKLSDRLLSITTYEESGFKNDRVELLFDDRDPYVPAPPDGAKLGISLGYVETGLIDKGTYEYDECTRMGTPARQLRVVGRAHSTASSFKTNRTQSYHDTTLGGIANILANRNNMTPMVIGGLDSIKMPHRDQTGHSDMAFLSQLAAENNAVMKMFNGMLIIAPRGMTKTASGQDVTNTLLNITDCKTWEYLKHSRGAYDAAAHQWHDPDSGATKTAPYPQGAASDAVTLMKPGNAANEDEAKAQATSDYFSASRSKDTFTFVVPGDANLACDCFISLAGFPDDVPVGWMISKCTNTFTNSAGWTTECVCELPPENGATEFGSGANTSDGGNPAQSAGDGSDGTQGDGIVKGGLGDGD